MSEAADVTRAIRSLTDEDAAARPAGVRRAKPVVVEDEDEPEAEAKPTAEGVADEPDEADGVSPEGEIEVDVAAEAGVAAEAELSADTTGIAGNDGASQPVSDEEANALLLVEDVRNDYQDPEFLTPKEVSHMCCTLGVQIHLAQLQKIRDAQLRGGIESAAEAVTLSFDPVKIMEIFDRATDSTKAGNNYLETVRRRMRVHEQQMNEAQGAIMNQGGQE